METVWVLKHIFIPNTKFNNPRIHIFLSNKNIHTYSHRLIQTLKQHKAGRLEQSDHILFYCAKLGTKEWEIYDYYFQGLPATLDTTTSNFLLASQLIQLCQLEDLQIWLKRAWSCGVKIINTCREVKIWVCYLSKHMSWEGHYLGTEWLSAKITLLCWMFYYASALLILLDLWSKTTTFLWRYRFNYKQ